MSILQGESGGAPSWPEDASVLQTKAGAAPCDYWAGFWAGWSMECCMGMPFMSDCEPIMPAC